ncbi:hypothetical protein KCP70_23590 [Salmonella enterica subsp. enterica]|nr:hypothetical protein KCP70_23590 [Salmonella enterica subsp. enterica]
MEPRTFIELLGAVNAGGEPTGNWLDAIGIFLRFAEFKAQFTDAAIKKLLVPTWLVKALMANCYRFYLKMPVRR